MNSFDQADSSADPVATDLVATMAGSSLREGRAAAQESLAQIERGFSTSIDTVRDFNLKLIAMMRSNAEAAFGLACSFANAASPTNGAATSDGLAQVEAKAIAESQEAKALIANLASQVEALMAQVATLQSKVAALEAAPVKVKAAFGETPHTGWTPSKVVVLGSDGNGGLAEIPSTIEQGGFSYPGAPSFWIAVG